MQRALGINLASKSTMLYLSSSEEVDVVIRSCWAGEAPAVFQLLIWWASLLVLLRIFGVRAALTGRRRPSRSWICGHSFLLDSLWLECPDTLAQDFWGRAPLRKSGVHLIIRCPSLLSALRGSVCQPCHPRCFRAQRSPASTSLSFHLET